MLIQQASVARLTAVALTVAMAVLASTASADLFDDRHVVFSNRDPFGGDSYGVGALAPTYAEHDDGPKIKGELPSLGIPRDALEVPELSALKPKGGPKHATPAPTSHAKKHHKKVFEGTPRPAPVDRDGLAVEIASSVLETDLRHKTPKPYHKLVVERHHDPPRAPRTR